MFQRILDFIREVIKKMFTQSTVKTALKVDVAVSSVMAEALQLWSAMYENKAPWLDTHVKSLSLAAAIAGEIARAVTIEMDVTIEGSPRADYLALQFERVLPKLRQQVEYGCAKGGLMLKPYIDGNQIAVDFVQADMFYPVRFDSNGNITACVFVDQKIAGNRYYTRLESHAMTDSGCEIRNMAFRSTSRDTLGVQIPLGEVAEWADIQPEAMITGVDQPLFAYFRFPQANNIDPTSPLGVSCYARAIDLIKQADGLWSDLLWEFESGNRALYVDVLAFGKDEKGKPILPNKRLYRTLNQGGQVSDEEMFHEWTPTIREQNYLAGLDAILKRIEYTCGLAYGTLSDPQQIDKTATEIKISRQRTYATIVDTQKTLQNALEQLLWAMDIWATLGNLAPRGSYSTIFAFDDSVIIDKDARFQQDMRLVQQGLMSKIEFRMRNMDEDEITAKAKIAEIQAEQPQVADLFRGV
jgi:A118 family predicted phage portal protein